MTSSPNSEACDLLASLNHTELYQACKRLGVNAHPSSTREELILALAGEEGAPSLREEDHPFDSWRWALIGFISDYWKTIQPQLKCPARMLHHPQEPDPRPCFKCTDAQVMTCVTNKKEVEQLIQLHRKKNT